ncbi:MAG: transcriptional repressor [Bacteroidota bacterium]
MYEELKSILKKHDLRVTDSRLEVLRIFIEDGNALSQGNVENRLSGHDRVTIYRTLNSFLDSGILHKIPNESGAATYGMCYSTCSPKMHNHEHVHFKCNSCGQMQCLNQEHIPPVTVPTGYKIDAVNMIVDGVCSKCA